MSQEAAVRPSAQILGNAPKPTFAALDKAINDAIDSLDLTDGYRAEANRALKNQLFLSPRLDRWQLEVNKEGVRGYSLKNSAQTATVTVQEERVILSCPDPQMPKHPYTFEVIGDDQTAGSLFQAIQDAQEIVQPRTQLKITSVEEEEAYFDDPEYVEGAGLDAALVETHPEPLGEDDAELIEDLAAESEKPHEEESVSVDTEPYDPKQIYSQEVLTEPKAESFTARANRKNASTDGVICTYCGNLNKQTYRGPCPQCPKKADVTTGTTPPVGQGAVLSRFKSLQGRVLTIIDGSFADKTQRDAVKSLINKEFRREISKVGGGE